VTSEISVLLPHLAKNCQCADAHLNLDCGAAAGRCDMNRMFRNTALCNICTQNNETRCVRAVCI